MQEEKSKVGNINERLETNSFKEAAFDEDEGGSNDDEVNDEEDEVEVDATEFIPGVEGGCPLAGDL